MKNTNENFFMSFLYLVIKKMYDIMIEEENQLFF